MGVIKINGITYGGGDNSVMLTQAEYDALVEAGTVDPTVLYMITDRNQSGGTYASGVIYDNTDSGLDATNVQTAIDELAETGGGAGVSVLTYAEYQELVDAGEVNPDISYYISDSNTTGTNYAAGISYDNTESGMTATDVQEAIDELAPVKASISNIDNVTITSPAVGDTLVWNGSAWVNTTNKIVQVKEFTKAYTVSANSYLNFSNDFITVPSGYSLLATLGYSSNDIMVNLPSCRPWDSSIYAFQLFNTRSTSVSNTFYIRIAFIKTEFLSS